MSDENPSIVSHLSVGTNDYPRARAFYAQVLATVGAREIMQHGQSAAFGKAFPEFWVGAPIDGRPAAAGNGMHVSFNAASTAQVDAFHAAALAAGGTDEGAPGYRPEYGRPYYGAFVRDLDGHKIEATFWDESAA
jgi:catechol 2,3-dioxygenase-like lactoylglutathione lyase family enzyme